MLVSAHIQRIILTGILILIYHAAAAQLMTLQQCIDTALVHNKNLQIHRNQVEISNQKMEQARGNLLPKVNVTADYRYFFNLPYQFMPMSLFGGAQGKYKEVQFGVPHNINGTLQLTVPLYNPQIKGAIQSAKTGIELNNLQLKKTEEQVRFEISNLYYNAQILKHQSRFIDSNLTNTQRLLRNMQLLREQLMATGTDVNKVALQADRLRIQKESIAGKEEQVIQTLKFLMGVPADKNIMIDADIKIGADLDEHSSTVDMQIAAVQNKLLRSELSTLKKSALPTAALVGSYGATGFGYDKKPDDFLKFHPVGFAGIQFTYSLFDGNALRRKRMQKELEIQNNELQQALIAEKDVMLTANAENEKRIARKSMEYGMKQIEQAQAIYDQTLLQQKEGLATLNDVLQADNDLRTAQQDYLSAIVDYLKAELESELRIKN